MILCIGFARDGGYRCILCILVQITVKATSHKGLRFAFLMYFEMQFTFLWVKSGVF
jgi:hypothetical protein